MRSQREENIIRELKSIIKEKRDNNIPIIIKSSNMIITEDLEDPNHITIFSNGNINSDTKRANKNIPTGYHLFNLRNYLNDMDISKTVLELAELNEGFEVVQNELLRKNINPEEKIKPIDNLEYLAKNYNENDLEKYGDGIPVAKEIEKYCKYIHSLVKDANDINFKFNDKGELNHV